MIRRAPHPVEPDVHDDRRALADAIFQDQSVTVDGGGKTNPHMSALYWLGYRKWGIAQSFTPPDSSRRRARLLNAFHGKPFHAELGRHLNGIGWRRPPDRECEDRVKQPLQAYCEIDADNNISWGFRDTPGRDLLRQAHKLYFVLVVFDGDDHVARVESQEWQNTTSIESLHLTDDDYRFEVSAVRDMWWGGKLIAGRWSGDWFDYAEIDGEWVELEFQGRDWSGEWEGSQRVHTAANIEQPEQTGDTTEQRNAEATAAREAERAWYAERKANANMRVVAMAQRNFNGDKLHPGRGYGANWFRTLWALGHRPRVWHGSLLQPEPTAPFTAADARREEAVWDGWAPFARELERLEGAGDAGGGQAQAEPAPEPGADAHPTPVTLPGRARAAAKNGSVTIARPDTWTGKGKIQIGGGSKALDRRFFHRLQITTLPDETFRLRWNMRPDRELRLTLEWQPMAGDQWQPSDGGPVDPFVLTVLPEQS